jgi:hypothetical protein
MAIEANKNFKKSVGYHEVRRASQEGEENNFNKKRNSPVEGPPNSPRNE